MPVWADQFAQLAVDLEKAGEHVAYQAPRVLVEHANRLAEVAKERCPRETGRLANSIWASVDMVGLSAEIGPFAYYAAFVEYGTHEMAPRPYMAPALAEVEPGFLEAFAQLGGDALNG